MNKKLVLFTLCLSSINANAQFYTVSQRHIPLYEVKINKEIIQETSSDAPVSVAVADSIDSNKFDVDALLRIGNLNRTQNKKYARTYAAAAIKQMKRYGIPASVTLAQGMLESDNGRSKLALQDNNHFGIKASSQWIKDGGNIGIYDDDRKNEKFCSYNSVEESFEHHSIILWENKRYRKCFSYSPDDYKSWCNELQRAGYATRKSYAKELINVIEKNQLYVYDELVLAAPSDEELNEAQINLIEDFLSVNYPLASIRKTSDYGRRTDPFTRRSRIHNGLDLKANYENVYAMMGGEVEKVGRDGRNGIFAIVRHQDYLVSYCHLSSVAVCKGDSLQAGDVIGISGNTGRSTGPHLHLTCRYKGKIIDPTVLLDYIADIREKCTEKIEILKSI